MSLEAVRVGLSVGLDVPLLRDRFVFTAADETVQAVHEAAPVAGLVSLSLGVAL